MPNDEKNPFDINDSDMILEKLGDIERVMTMRLTQANKQGMDDRQDMELMQQLLVKVTAGINRLENLKLNMDGVEKVTIQGKPGEDGKDSDPFEVARILRESEEFLASLKGDQGERGEKGETGEKGEQGEKGADGKTPEKGKDYFTQKEIDSIKKDVEDVIMLELPKEVERKMKSYITIDEIVQKVNSLVEKRKVTTKDVDGLAELFKQEIDKVYETVSTYAARSGGGTLKLAALNDVDTKGLQNGYVLKYNSETQTFYFGAGGGGGGSTSDDISNESGVSGTTVTDALDTLLSLINAIPPNPFIPVWNPVATDLPIDFGTGDDGIYVLDVAQDLHDITTQNIVNPTARKVVVKHDPLDHDEIDVIMENITAEIVSIDVDIGTYQIAVRAPQGTWGRYLLTVYVLQTTS